MWVTMAKKVKQSHESWFFLVASIWLFGDKILLNNVYEDQKWALAIGTNL